MNSKFLLSEKFEKSIPIGKREVVYAQLFYFSSELKRVENNISNMGSGFWVRKIRGIKDIYKFRLNNQNRILFTYYKYHGPRKRYLDNVIFLKYVTHDAQIRDAKQLSVIKIKKEDYYTSPHFEIEDRQDKKEYPDLESNPLLANEVFKFVKNETYLNLLLDRNNQDYLFYLSDEQFKCLFDQSPLLIEGSAGSGKTTIGIHKLFNLSAYNERAAYITYTESLRNHAFNFYNKSFVSR